MARAATKTDLLLMASEQFDKFWKLVDTLKEDVQTLTFDFGEGFDKKEAHWNRDKNLRDVYIHLYEWHQLLLNCVEANKEGAVKPFLPEPYNWKSYGQMNVGFWEKHQSTSYDYAKKMLLESHNKVSQMILDVRISYAKTAKHLVTVDLQASLCIQWELYSNS